MGEAGEAKWRIASTGPSRKMYSVTSWKTKRYFRFPARWAMFRTSPVTRLSRPTTSCPSARSRSDRWLPRKPAAPVTTMRIDPRSYGSAPPDRARAVSGVELGVAGFADRAAVGLARAAVDTGVLNLHGHEPPPMPRRVPPAAAGRP